MEIIKKIFLGLVLCCFSVGCGGGSSDLPVPRKMACRDIGLPIFKVIDGTACGNLSSAAVVRVLLQVDGSSPHYETACTGTVISNNQVLTAAHCFVKFIRGNAVIGAGVGIGNLEQMKIVSAENVSIHPGFAVTNQVAVNDVAVMTLSQSLTIKPIPIFASRGPSEGSVVDIFGYGQTKIGAISSSDFRDLVSGQMQVKGVTDSLYFAEFSGEGSNVCFGDSGGPLMYKNRGRVGIVGVVSEGTSKTCNVGDVTAFSNLHPDSVLSWIRSVAPGASII